MQRSSSDAAEGIITDAPALQYGRYTVELGREMKEKGKKYRSIIIRAKSSTAPRFSFVFIILFH